MPGPRREKKAATDLLRSRLEPELTAAIDWSTLKLASSEYVDEALDDSRSDLLFEVDVGDRPDLLYLLVEHQSTAHPMMPFRVVRRGHRHAARGRRAARTAAPRARALHR